MTRLEKLEQLDREATKGPWKYDGKRPVKIGYVARCPYANAVNNANFIAASRAALPELIALVKVMRDALVDAEGYSFGNATAEEHYKRREALAAFEAFDKGDAEHRFNQS